MPERLAGDRRAALKEEVRERDRRQSRQDAESIPVALPLLVLGPRDERQGGNRAEQQDERRDGQRVGIQAWSPCSPWPNSGSVQPAIVASAQSPITTAMPSSRSLSEKDCDVLVCVVP